MGEFSLHESTIASLRSELKKAGVDMNEDALINALDDPSVNKYTKYRATIALRKFGTKKSVPSLKRMIDYPMQDVKDCSVLTIAEISGKTGIPFLVDLLDKPKFKKAYTLWAIQSINDKSAIEPVKNYMRDRLKFFHRPSAAKITGGIEYGLIYLDRYSLVPGVEEILMGYQSIWNKFSLQDQKKLQDRTEFYKQQPLKPFGDEPGKRAKKKKPGFFQSLIKLIRD